MQRTPQMSGILPGMSRAALPQEIITLGVFTASLWEEKNKAKTKLESTACSHIPKVIQASSFSRGAIAFQVPPHQEGCCPHIAKVVLWIYSRC